MTRIQRLLNALSAWKSIAIPGSLVIIIVFLIRAFGLLQPLEWMAFDSLMRLRPSESIDQRIVVVAIDDEDIQQLKTYPIPDRELAATITKLQRYQPSAIGLDLFRDLPVEPGHAELLKAFKTYPNLFAIEQLPFDQDVAIQPPKNVPVNQVGFANSMPPDRDGHIRRHILGATDPQYLNRPEAVDHYKYSLATQLALQFLMPKGYKDEAGIADPETLRLGTVEFPRLQSNTGGYVGVDAGGTQVLINYRAGANPFRVLSLRNIRQDQFQPDWIRDKVILIGTSAIGVKDFANVGAVLAENSIFYPGVKVHAHAVSQILAAVLDNRPLLKTWTNLVEYLWIALWGISGIAIGRRLRSPWMMILTAAILSIALALICYVSLISGWWIPLVPALLVLLLNGIGLPAGVLYLSAQELESLRQAELEQVFNSIHNRPLQQLSVILRRLKDQPNPPMELITQLDQVDKDLRSLRHDIGRMTQKQSDRIRLGDQVLSLDTPLNELLEVVCATTLKRTEDFPTFKDVKVRLIDIPSESQRMISDRGLTLAQKDWLCRFLEESICNVGKHGRNVTQIKVFCGKEYKYQVIRVTDNGEHQNQVFKARIGTKAARNLARQLRGKFRRFPNQPKGVVCELKWRSGQGCF